MRVKLIRRQQALPRGAGDREIAIGRELREQSLSVIKMPRFT